MGNIIPVYLDTESVGIGYDKKLKEMGAFIPTADGVGRRFSVIVETEMDESAKSDRILPFKEAFERLVEFIERDCDKARGDRILITGWNVLTADMVPIWKRCRELDITLREDWAVRDMLPIVRQVFSFDGNTLQEVREHLGIPPWDLHRAAPDAEGVAKVVDIMARHVSMQDFLNACAIEEGGLILASEMLLRSYTIVPIFWHLTLSGKHKIDRYEDDNPLPWIVRLEAYCPSSSAEQWFQSLVKPHEEVEINTLYTEGVPKKDILKAKPFNKVFKHYVKWLQMCADGDVTSRIMMVSYSCFRRDMLIFKRLCEIYGKKLPHNVHHFSLAYLKSCLHPSWSEAKLKEKGKEWSLLQKREFGFPFEPKWNGMEDETYYELLEHYQIPVTDNRLEDTHQLYEAMVGSKQDPEITLAMHKQSKEIEKSVKSGKKFTKGRIKAVANVIKTRNIARPIFCKLNTTGIGKNGNGVGIVEIEAYAPWKADGDQYFHSYVNPDMDIEEGAYEKHGIINRDLLLDPTWRDVAPNFWRWAAAGFKSWEKVVVMVHQASFFKNVLRFNAERYSSDSEGTERFDGLIRRDVQYFDIKAMAQTLYGTKESGMDALAVHFGVENNRNVFTLEEVFSKMIEDCDEKEVYRRILNRSRKTSSKEVAEYVQVEQVAQFLAAKEKAAAKKESVVPKSKGRRRSSRKAKKNV